MDFGWSCSGFGGFLLILLALFVALLKFALARVWLTMAAEVRAKILNGPYSLSSDLI